MARKPTSTELSPTFNPIPLRDAQYYEQAREERRKKMARISKIMIPLLSLGILIGCSPQETPPTIPPSPTPHNLDLTPTQLATLQATSTPTSPQLEATISMLRTLQAIAVEEPTEEMQAPTPEPTPTLTPTPEYPVDEDRDEVIFFNNTSGSERLRWNSVDQLHTFIQRSLEILRENQQNAAQYLRDNISFGRMIRGIRRDEIGFHNQNRILDPQNEVPEPAFGYDFTVDSPENVGAGTELYHNNLFQLSELSELVESGALTQEQLTQITQEVSQYPAYADGRIPLFVLRDGVNLAQFVRERPAYFEETNGTITQGKALEAIVTSSNFEAMQYNTTMLSLGLIEALDGGADTDVAFDTEAVRGADYVKNTFMIENGFQQSDLEQANIPVLYLDLRSDNGGDVVRELTGSYGLRILEAPAFTCEYKPDNDAIGETLDDRSDQYLDRRVQEVLITRDLGVTGIPVEGVTWNADADYNVIITVLEPDENVTLSGWGAATHIIQNGLAPLNYSDSDFTEVDPAYEVNGTTTNLDGEDIWTDQCALPVIATLSAPDTNAVEELLPGSSPETENEPPVTETEPPVMEESDIKSPDEDQGGNAGQVTDPTIREEPVDAVVEEPEELPDAPPAQATPPPGF